MKNFIRTTSSITAAFSLLFSGLAFSQSSGINNFKKSYESSCVKEQVKRHSGIKGITANQFIAHCACVSNQLSRSLNTGEIEALLSNQTRPSWFKEKESAATRSCLTQEPKIQVRFLDPGLNQVLG